MRWMQKDIETIFSGIRRMGRPYPDHSGGSFVDVVFNSVLFAALTSFLIAQALKPFTYWLETRRVQLARSFGSGGMPSSHTALVAGLTSAVGVKNGFQDPLFAICVVLLAITAYDASNVRREAGKHAQILASMMTRTPEIYFSDDVLRGEPLKMNLGHTPAQVVAGGILGLVAGFLVQYCIGNP